ncbi:TetR/AcrR family transcriptional regulator [Vibrio sp. SCSIO 43136]|uniref:TetR/AcrR family transcriptional regulator n=1 Tax=Vibrio sp. SCSIO 43136 TaxID=2819101 RepID=UPI002074CD1E|nr:TetR/AcrR family transcriptional regulator [Vibrio sp. SCSIO 43136]USD65130.1 TetR/AcrR family transcriptional regulator [Vibrio sp. SCSIO 43136]
MKTRDKITYGALELFNEQGERNITTNHIAAHLDISPGNLYYHYRNKQEIVRSIFELYSSELLEKFAPIKQPGNGMNLLEYYMESIFTLMWKYRFLYANLPEILSRDSELHNDYLLVQSKLQANLVAIMQEFRAIKLLSATDEELRSLLRTLHLIATSWLSYQITLSTHNQVTEKIIIQGMKQMMAIVKPYATPEGVVQLKSIEIHLGD